MNSDQKMTLVFFIGGCTHANDKDVLMADVLMISAFRYLSNETTSEFIVATTCLINGKSILDSLNDIAS